MEGKTILILINNAYRMGRYHFALGKSLKEKGAKVIFALADRLPFYSEELDLEGFKYYDFSSFFKDNYSVTEVAQDLKAIHVNKLFFSEYDRTIVFGKMEFLGNIYYTRLMANLINFFDIIFKENGVDFCVYESISNSFGYAAYEVGKIRGVPYIGYQGSRLKNRFELYTEEFGSRKLFRDVFDRQQLASLSEEEYNEISTYLRQYDAKTMPTYHPRNTRLDWNFSIFKRYVNTEKLHLFKASILFAIKENKLLRYSYQTRNPVKEYIKAFTVQLKKVYKTRTSIKFFDTPDYNTKYFLYPQHFKPEASTSVLARHYCSDVGVIENIAFNLPFGTELYVKEHFVNFGRMSTDFYRRLKKIPNVRLIRCEENTKQLVDRSQGVITLTSTVGLEALFIGKPVFVLGKVFYDCHPNCRIIESFDNLHEELRSLEVDLNPEINIRFLAAYKKITFEGNIGYSISDESYKAEYFTEPFINAIDERISSEDL